MKWRNMYDFNPHFPHVVMRPLPNVLHVHFKKRDDAMFFLGRLGLLGFKKPVERQRGAGRGGPFHDSWNGICWSGVELPPPMADSPAFGGTLLRREIEQVGPQGNLIATHGGNWGHNYVVQHELAHAVWDLKPTYRERAQAVVAKMSPPLRRDILQNLTLWGYVDSKKPLADQKELLANETQAFIFCGRNFEKTGNRTLVIKKRRELAYHRAKLYEAMECHYPIVNHSGDLQVWHWRTLHDARQGAAYVAWRGKDCVRCETLNATDVVLPARPSSDVGWGEGRIYLPWKEVEPIAVVV